LEQIEQTLQLWQAMIQEEVTDSLDRMQSGYDKHLDSLRQQAQHSDDLLLAYQQEVMTKTGVSVKIKQVTHQGYFLEVTPKDIQRFESQSLASDEKR